MMPFLDHLILYYPVLTLFSSTLLLAGSSSLCLYLQLSFSLFLLVLFIHYEKIMEEREGNDHDASILKHYQS